MRNLIFPAAVVASLMLGSAAFAADPQAATAASGPMTAAAPVVQHEVAGGRFGAPREKAIVSRAVSYADLNLADPADVKILDQRIQSAAKEDCAQLRDQSDALNPTIAGGHCVRSAVREASSSIRPSEMAAAALQ